MAQGTVASVAPRINPIRLPDSTPTAFASIMEATTPPTLNVAGRLFCDAEQNNSTRV